MARITVRVSDLTGNQIQDERSSVRLFVEHPDFPEPVGLDVLPDEVLPHLSDENSRFVVVSLEDPENPNPQRYVLTFDDFERLFDTAESTSVLQDAFQAQQQEREQEEKQPRRRGRRQDGGGKRQRVDYSSAEHAGEPHRGIISEEERIYVQTHLDEVNERLREQGLREIDPTDLTMIERYGFTPPEEF
jgi:hypothetical protein